MRSRCASSILMHHVSSVLVGHSTTLLATIGVGHQLVTCVQKLAV
jgi:hypothetical protein